MRQLTTKKLFYNKHSIKVECYVKGASKVHRLGADYTIEWCHGRLKDTWDYYQDKNIDKVDLAKFANSYKNVESNIKQVRSEGSNFHLFFSDKSILDDVKKNMAPWIYSITAPENDQQEQFLKDNGHKKVLCNALPWDKYRYRIYFTYKFEATARQKFLAWAEKYGDKVDLPGRSKEWLEGSKHYVQDPFMYIIDEKMLSMVLLYLGSHVKKVQEFITKDSINT